MNVLEIVVGNLCSLLAMVTDSISSAQKTAKRVLWVQTLSQLIYFIGTVILKGYSGAAQNAVSIVRNLVASKGIGNKVTEWILVLMGVGLGLGFNNLGLVGLLPVVANFQYTLCIFRFQDNERALKTSFMISVGLFAAFNVAIYNWVGATSNAAVCITTAIALLRSKK